MPFAPNKTFIFYFGICVLQTIVQVYILQSNVSTTAVVFAICRQRESKKDCAHNCNFSAWQHSVSRKHQKYYKQKQIPIIFKHISPQQLFYHNMHHHATKWFVFFTFLYANMLIWKPYLILKRQHLSKTIYQETQCSILYPNFLVHAQTQREQKSYVPCL